MALNDSAVPGFLQKINHILDLTYSENDDDVFHVYSITTRDQHSVLMNRLSLHVIR